MGFSIENIGARSVFSQGSSQNSMKSLLSQEIDLPMKTDMSKQSRGYMHLGGDTQNQGNVLGDVPCVRQSKIGRQHEGGNSMKDILGQGHLKWEIEHAQGAYEGHNVYKISDSMDHSPSNQNS